VCRSLEDLDQAREGCLPVPRLAAMLAGGNDDRPVRADASVVQLANAGFQFGGQ
jgi:hypothetical protein